MPVEPSTSTRFIRLRTIGSMIADAQIITVVMIATDTGQVTAYALDALYDRGFFFVKPGDQVYEGQIVGEHCKEKDIPVNVVKSKQLTNIRSSGKDEAVKITTPIKMTLEKSLAYITDEELVEVTPQNIRLRKRTLDPIERKRQMRAAQAAGNAA